MTFKEFLGLSEEYAFSVKIGKDVAEVFKNPQLSELPRSKFYRGLFDLRTENLYVWPYDKAMHQDIARKLDPDTYETSMVEMTLDNGKVYIYPSAMGKIKKKEKLKRFFSGDFDFFSFGTGERLTEEWADAVKVGKEARIMDIFKNPSPSEVGGWQIPVRGFLYNDTIYCWSAKDSIHMVVILKMGLKDKLYSGEIIPFWVGKQGKKLGVFVSDMGFYKFAGVPINQSKAYDTLQKSSVIKRLIPYKVQKEISNE